MRILSRILELLFATALAYLAAMTACAGVDVDIGPIGLHSGKVIVPGMIAWLAGFGAGFLRWRRNRPHPDAAPEADFRSHALLALAWIGSVALCGLALARALDRPFFMDDMIMMKSAAAMRPDLVPDLFRGHSWSTPGFIRPLPELVWWAEYHVHGCQPLYCHLLNLSVHGANVLLVGAIAMQLLGDARRAAFAMALFAVCGTHAEPLLWLSSRYDLIATFWVLAALAAFLAERTAVSVACTLLALFSKEAALTLPLGLALVEVIRRRRLVPRAALPHLALLGAYVVYRLSVLGTVTSTSSHESAWVGIDKLVELPLAVLAPLSWPFNIEQLADLPAHARALLGAGLAAAPLLAAGRVARGPCRAAATAYGLLVVLAIPVHNVISLSATLRQSRYVYLPAALFAVAIVACTRGLPVRRAGLALAVLVACNFALLRSNAEPFAAAAAVVNRVIEQSGPVIDALQHGKIVSLAGLPLYYRGTPVCNGHTVMDALMRRAAVPEGRVWVEGDDWPGAAPPPPDARFAWSPEGFRPEALRSGAAPPRTPTGPPR